MLLLYGSHDPQVHEPVHDVLHIERSGRLDFRETACYASWWGKHRHEDGAVCLSIRPFDGITDAKIRTIESYVLWMRDLGYDVRMGRRLGKHTFTGVRSSYPYLELVYRSRETNAAWFYVGLCLMRFLTPEFINTIPPDASPEVVLVEHALNHQYTYASAHMPIQNAYRLYPPPDTKQFAEAMFLWFHKELSFFNFPPITLADAGVYPESGVLISDILQGVVVHK